MIGVSSGCVWGWVMRLRPPCVTHHGGSSVSSVACDTCSSRSTLVSILFSITLWLADTPPTATTTFWRNVSRRGGVLNVQLCCGRSTTSTHGPPSGCTSRSGLGCRRVFATISNRTASGIGCLLRGRRSVVAGLILFVRGGGGSVVVPTTTRCRLPTWGV